MFELIYFAYKITYCIITMVKYIVWLFQNCKLLEGLRLMHLEHRVLLSGTPLQNNVNELFSLLNFLEPAQFASQDAFLTEFGSLVSDEQVS